jgi:hypothetical protein
MTPKGFPHESLEANEGGDPSLEERHFNNASHFIRHLRLSDSRWGSDWQSEWTFRGQADARWSLLPSAYRDDPQSPIVWAKRCFDSMLDRSKLPNLSNSTIQPKFAIEEVLQFAAEFELVRQFAKMAQEAGLPTPGFDKHMTGEEIVKHPERYSPGAFEPTQVFALAQHHGVPTRLLDWTDDPLSAAFFAARDCFDRCRKRSRGDDVPKKLAVWAFNLRCISSIPGLRIFNPDKSENPFLRAQNGIFIWDQSAHGHFLNHGTRIALNKRTPLPRDECNIPRLKKLTLSAKAIPELLKLLFRERVSMHLLMPWYDAAATTANSVFIWGEAAKNDRWQSDRAFKLP